jgi:hypothetical protein
MASSLIRPKTPNHALQRTAPCVTAPASAAAFPPAVQVPRRTPRSLSLGSLDGELHFTRSSLDSCAVQLRLAGGTSALVVVHWSRCGGHVLCHDSGVGDSRTHWAIHSDGDSRRLGDANHLRPCPFFHRMGLFLLRRPFRHEGFQSKNRKRCDANHLTNR